MRRNLTREPIPIIVVLTALAATLVGAAIVAGFLPIVGFCYAIGYSILGIVRVCDRACASN